MRVRPRGARGGGGGGHVVTVMVEAVQNIEPRSNICLQFFRSCCREPRQPHPVHLVYTHVCFNCTARVCVPGETHVGAVAAVPFLTNFFWLGFGFPKID